MSLSKWGNHQHDIENKEIVRTIITLAKTRGMSVIAEGVETTEQARLLRELECVQGFLILRPFGPDQADRLILGSLSQWEEGALKREELDNTRLCKALASSYSM